MSPACTQDAIFPRLRALQSINKRKPALGVLRADHHDASRLAATDVSAADRFCDQCPATAIWMRQCFNCPECRA